MSDHDTEAIDRPQKHCNKCGKDFPATTEFFYQGYLTGKERKNICKVCHKEDLRAFSTSKKKLKEIAQSIEKDEVPSYQTLNAVARSIGSTPAKVERDVYESKLPVFKFIYNNAGPALALKLEDARSYIATHRLNGHRQTNEITEPIIIEAPTTGTPDLCGSCGTEKGNIFGDVDVTTGKRYGYLCMKCYKLVRVLGEDPERIHEVLKYVESTRLSRVLSTKKMPTMPQS